MNPHGRAFLITGGSSGLGAACARRLTGAGANVVLSDLNETLGNALAKELGAKARFIRTDVTEAASTQAAVDLATSTFGSLAGAINCAGIVLAMRVLGKEGPHDLAAFARVLNVNVVGTFNVVRLAAAAISGNEPDAEGERGVIINTASCAAFEGQIGQAAYSASKAAVAGMTLPLARELARFGIRVMTIAPGTFDTPMMAALPPAARESLAAQVPFPPRLGRPEEYAMLAEQIIMNPMLNGEVIRLDGAMRMGAK
jgi:NAD(P)-dependent dehydrogenase (short-subunit alcohol dehydrogenase family)